MSRTFEPNKLVHLPALDALAAQTVGSAVLAAAANKTLPDPIVEALAEVKVAVEALQTTNLEAIPTGDTFAPRAADIDLDNAWSVLHGLVRAVSRVPDQPRAELATALLDDLFPDGLQFTRLRFKLEWAESENRLKMIDQRGFAPQIEQLGGATALAQIRQAHAHYGEVLSVSTARTPASGISIREARDAVMKALRQFVARVTVTIRDQDPPSAALARELLAPIETWERTVPPQPANDTPAPPAPPASPAPVVTSAPVATDPAPGAGGAVVKAQNTA
jgi:hypothetical protein